MTMLPGKHMRLLVVFGSAVALTASFRYSTTSREHLNAALENNRICERLAAEIRDTRQSPQLASSEKWSQDDLGAAVEAAAGEAQLARDRVLRIDPQLPKRLGKSDYLEQSTEVELSAVTLRQLVDFLCVISSRDEQLANGTLRMRVPHELADSSGAETWLADIILTQRIYAPTTPHR